MSNRRERESQQALRERTELVDQEKELTQVKTHLAKRVNLLKGKPKIQCTKTIQ